MGKHKHISTHHLYLGAGGVVAVVALVVALTFGLSSAQDSTDPCPGDECPGVCCGGGTYTPPPSTCTPPPSGCMTGTWNQTNCMCEGGTYTPPPSGCTSPPAGCPSGQWWDSGMCMCKSSDSGTMPPPTGGCTAPPAGCGSGSTWNQSMCMCQGGTYMPPPSGCTTPMPSTPCSVSNHYECQNNAWSCVTNTMPGGMTCTAVGGDCCLAGSTSDPDCLGGQMPPPVTNVQCTSPMQPFSGPSGQMSCYDPATLPTCSSTVFSPCKAQGWAPPPATTGCPGTPPPCGQGMYSDCTSNGTWQCKSTTQGQYPSAQQCQAGFHPTADMGCVKDQMMQDQWQQPQQPQEPQYFQQGQCPQDMLSCDDSWMPGNKVCKTKKFFQWDPQTQKSTEKAMTCESWAAQEKADQEKWSQQGTGMGMGMGGMSMGGMGMMNMGMMGNFGQQGMQSQGMQGQWFDMKGKDQGQMNPCEMNPNDPFCKAGFDFSQMQDQYKFDESQFQDHNMNPENAKHDIKELKNNAKNWVRDVKQIKQQLKEINRESSGFACPTAVEVSAIAQQYEDAINQVNALNEKSSQEEIQKGMGLRDFVSGRWQDGEQVTVGLQQKLFGMQDENGERIPGKMESLNGCRELSNIVRDACTMAKDITREAARVKKSGAPESVTKIFDEVVAGLNLRCTNPLAALPSGVSMDELFKPFNPDPEICGEFMYGPGPGGPGGPGGGGPGGGGGGQGPMPMQFEQMMNQGGQGGFGGMEGLDPSMMEIMKKKFMQMQKGEGNFQGFNPFGASVLSAQAFGDDEEFGGEFGPPEGMQGFREPPEECMPPAQRYLSPHRLMRKLEETRGVMDKQFEEMNVCNMLKMATDFIESGEAEGQDGPPPEVVSLVKSGAWQEACDSGDTETLAKIKAKLMRLGPPGGRGPGPKGKGKGGFGGMIDIDKLVEDKLNEKLASLMGLVEGEEIDKTTTAQMKILEQRIADLQAKLDDAAKTILALNERLSEMTTKLAAVVELNDSATKAINNIAKLPDETVQNVTRVVSTLTDKVDEAKQVLPAEADKSVDAAMNEILRSPPSSRVVEDIAGKLNTIISYAQSGARKAEIIEKVKDQLAEVAVLNAADVSNKVTEGIVASRDTADLSQWYAVPALSAVNEGFASISKDNPDFKPAEPETKCAAVTRFARIMEKAGEMEEIDMDNKAPVAGAPEWCRPFIHAMRAEGVPFVENLRDPNAPIDRGEVAVLIHQAIGNNLPDPPSIADYVTPDMKNLPVDMQNAIAEIRYNRIMDTTDGTNFSPTVDFNRAQNAVVSTNTYDRVVEAQENQE